MLAAYYRRHQGKGGVDGKRAGLKATFLVVGQGEWGGKEVLLLPEERVQGACVTGDKDVCLCVWTDRGADVRKTHARAPRIHTTP